MSRGLKYFTYISRAKVDQLYQQITDFAVEKRSVKRQTERAGDVEAGSGALLGFLKTNFKLEGRHAVDVEEIVSHTSVQKLAQIISHINSEEKTLSLNELCAKREGKALDAFCFTYSGRFRALGSLGRGRFASVNIPLDTLEGQGDEIVISKSLLINPALAENQFEEAGPRGQLVSNMCLLNSECHGYTISLACSYKYFADMGGAYDEKSNEWDVHPHSGNYHFFEGKADAFFDSLIFVNGIRSTTIMGTPLFLAGSIDPGWRI